MLLNSPLVALLATAPIAVLAAPVASPGELASPAKDLIKRQARPPILDLTPLTADNGILGFLTGHGNGKVKRQGNVLEMVETGVETALDEVTEDLKDFVPSLGDAEGNGGE